MNGYVLPTNCHGQRPAGAARSQQPRSTSVIVVSGATGSVGRDLIEQLSAGREPVRALVRDPSNATFASNVEVKTGDLAQPESLAPALAGARAVFLLGGHPDMPAVLSAIRRAGVERVVLLSSRSVLIGDPSNAIVKMWLDSEAAVRDSGVSWTLLRPSGFASNALRWRPQLRAGNVIRAPFAQAKIASIDPADIAAVAVLALSREELAGQALELSGPEAQLPEQQVRILAKVLDRPLQFQAQPDEEAFNELKKSAPPGFAEAFRRFFVEGEFDDARLLPTVRELTGREPRSFEAWAKRNAKSFQSGVAT
jgi:uncharacterized protein YbjT (DUF2867 family)